MAAPTQPDPNTFIRWNNQGQNLAVIDPFDLSSNIFSDFCFRGNQAGSGDLGWKFQGN